MGRGRSKSGGVTKASAGVTSVTVQSGQTVDLEKPLVYGDNDKAIAGNLRASLEAQETKRLKAKTEYGCCYDENGNLIGREYHEGRGSVAVPSSVMSDAKVFTHNHPRGKGEETSLGGTFSTADINLFAARHQTTNRASAAEGTYSITKGNNFNGQGLVRYYNSAYSQAKTGHNQRESQLVTKFRSGSISYSEKE